MTSSITDVADKPGAYVVPTLLPIWVCCPLILGWKTCKSSWNRATRCTSCAKRWTVSKDIDEIFIDTPPALNFYTRSALIAADTCLIPFDCDDFSGAPCTR